VANLRALAYKIKNNITDSAFDDLRHLFPDANLGTFKTVRKRLAALAQFDPVLYDCCPNSCLCYVGPNANLLRCPYCEEDRYSARKQPRKRFNYIPITPRLQSLFLDATAIERMGYRAKFPEETQDPSTIQDIFDSQIYDFLCTQNVCVAGVQLPYKYFSQDTDIALGFASDGFAPFRNRKQTCWPILVYNLNLPPEHRFLLCYLLCAGVIPGPRKPKDFDSFLYPFVQELMELALGVETLHSVLQQFIMRAFTLFGGGDMPAVAMMMRMKGHNGYCPCRMCHILGLRMPGSTTYYVPLQLPKRWSSKDSRDPANYDPRNLPLRTVAEFMYQAHQVQFASTQAEEEELAKQTGIKGIPILSQVPSLLFPHSFPFDFMHLVYENLIKNLIDLWTGSFKNIDHTDENYVIDKKVWKAIGEATARSGSTIPGAYGARPLNFSEDRKGVTADMLSFWTLYLGPIYLEKAFPDQTVYNHFVELVCLINICLQFEIERNQLPHLKESFAAWVEKYEEYVYLAIPYMLR
jgi:hypothetical protein